MPFRDPRQQLKPRLDPLERFLQIEAAFDADRGMLGDRVPLRLAAINLLLAPGEPAEIAAGVREFHERFDLRGKWYAALGSSMELLLCAILYEHGDTPEAFADEFDRLRPRLREYKLRGAETYQIMAMLLLRLHNELGPVEDAQLERMAAMFEAMKSQHRWLTGVEDYPACAFFVTQPGEPEQHAAHANAVYNALRKHGSVWRGNALQTASNMLALSPLEPDELGRRFAAYAQRFKQHKLKVRIADYDEVALLCFLAHPIEKVVDMVVHYREQVSDRLPQVMGPHAFTLAANLAYVRLLGNDETLGKLGDLKALLDMQAIIAARAAAAAAAGAA